MRLTKYEHLTPIVAPDAAPSNDFSVSEAGRACAARALVAVCGNEQRVVRGDSRSNLWDAATMTGIASYDKTID
jgi:4'-phosphopantetheinyl transferase EntD